MKTPFVTFTRSWSSALPVCPGAHGIGFCDLKNSPLKHEPLNFFVGEGKNDWRLVGTYDFLRWGEIAPHHTSLLPATVLESRVEGMLKTVGGKAKIETANAGLDDASKIDFTYDSVLQATRDGRLAIPFSILRCVGYPEDWFERLLYYEKHPKPKKSPGKRQGAKAKGSPKKQVKTSQKGKRTVEKEPSTEDESDGDSEGDETSEDEDSEYFDEPRRIVGLPKRSSPRKPRAMSIEL